MTQRAGTASAARILDLLLTIADANHPVIAKDLADWSELPLSTVYRYLSLLRTKGLIWSIGSGQYAIGPRALQLARSFEESFSLAAVCRPLLQRLARDTDETVALVVPLGESAACVETVESPHALRYSFTRGAVLPLLRGASAKALLPYLPKAAVERAMDRAGFRGEARQQLWDDIDRIARQGFAESQGEVDAGVWAVGVPIFGPRDELLGALSIIVPVARLDPARRTRFIQQALSAAHRITAIAQRHMPPSRQSA